MLQRLDALRIARIYASLLSTYLVRKNKTRALVMCQMLYVEDHKNSSTVVTIEHNADLIGEPIQDPRDCMKTLPNT